MKLKIVSTMAIAALLATGCNNDTPSSGNTKNDQPKVDSPQKKTPEVADAPGKAQKPPVMNFVDTVMVKRTILYMKDSAATMDRIGMKLGGIYADKLAKFMKANKISATGAPMAWYQTDKAPYFFEAGMPVEKAPAKLAPGILAKELPAGNVMVAHFFGPYELMRTAYEAAKARMAERKMTATGAPFEIYIGDPVVQKDPYKVQTDIVFPVKMPDKP